MKENSRVTKKLMSVAAGFNHLFLPTPASGLDNWDDIRLACCWFDLVRVGS